MHVYMFFFVVGVAAVAGGVVVNAFAALSHNLKYC